MAWHDYIKIAGYSGTPTEGADPGTFEIFQGLGGKSAGFTTAPDGGSDLSMLNDTLTAIADALRVQDGTEGLQAWLDAVSLWFEEEEIWIDASIAYSEQEGSRGGPPAPIPPKLPDLMKFIPLPALIAQFGPWGIVVWVGLNVAKRLLEGWIEKKMNPGVGELKQVLQDIRDALKKGLLYDGETEPILLKAFLDTEFKSYLRGLPDLAYVDETIDFGAFRCHIKGKMIEY